MRGISLVAIVAGGFVDILLTAVIGATFLMYAGSSRGLWHGWGAPSVRASAEAIYASPALYAAELGIGLFCSIVGGFVAASIAKQRRILNGTLASWLCIGTGIVGLLGGHHHESTAMTLGLITLIPLCYSAGAWLRDVMWRTTGSMV